LSNPDGKTHPSSCAEALSTLPNYVLYFYDSLNFQADTANEIEIVLTPFNSPRLGEGADHEVHY
jgi:hypothetical protein